jgi:hypothetical protein
MAVAVSVKIPGLKELEKRLDDKLLVQPEIEKALDTISQRPLRVSKKAGGQLGIKNNLVTVKPAMALSREVSTSLNWPRTRGTAWNKKVIGQMKAVSQNALKAAFVRMKARFDAPLPGA